jgi:hypothetical protein
MEMHAMALRTKGQNQKLAQRIKTTLRPQNVLRIHNTGKPNGVTFDPNYVPNALGVMSEYELLEG